MKFVKMLLGLALLPAAFAVAATLGDLLMNLPATSGGIPPGFWWFAGGFAFWIVLWFALPRPARSYVLAHELTHAIWGIAWGATVSKLRVRAEGGSVNLSKTNVWITLAPYFFPLYTLLVILIRLAFRLFVPAAAPYDLFWLALVGLTWGFHVTFTLAVLAQRQPDVQEHGRIFSWTLIFILNAVGLLVWILSVTRGDWLRCIAALGGRTLAAYGEIIRLLAAALHAAISRT